MTPRRRCSILALGFWAGPSNRQHTAGTNQEQAWSLNLWVSGSLFALEAQSLINLPGTSVEVRGSMTRRALAPSVVFGIAIGCSLVVGVVLAALIYLCVSKRRQGKPLDLESRVKSVRQWPFIRSDAACI
jgi:hypothetical protein